MRKKKKIRNVLFLHVRFSELLQKRGKLQLKLACLEAVKTIRADR